jgi:hypothetical protein
MRDFTIVIDKLPEAFRAYQDDISMKVAIWKQITGRIKDAKKCGFCNFELNSEIVSINFGVKNYEILSSLKQINELCSYIELLNLQLQKTFNATEL